MHGARARRMRLWGAEGRAERRAGFAAPSSLRAEVLALRSLPVRWRFANQAAVAGYRRGIMCYLAMLAAAAAYLRVNIFIVRIDYMYILWQ